MSLPGRFWASPPPDGKTLELWCYEVEWQARHKGLCEEHDLTKHLEEIARHEGLPADRHKWEADGVEIGWKATKAFLASRQARAAAE